MRSYSESIKTSFKFIKIMSQLLNKPIIKKYKRKSMLLMILYDGINNKNRYQHLKLQILHQHISNTLIIHNCDTNQGQGLSMLSWPALALSIKVCVNVTFIYYNNRTTADYAEWKSAMQLIYNYNIFNSIFFDMTALCSNWKKCVWK